MIMFADLPVHVGTLPAGTTGSVLDVPGVGLGHTTVCRDEPDPPAGRGVARTGVTVLHVVADAYHRPVPCGVAVLNGAGELTGSLGAREWGLLATPVFLTSTMQVGRVYDAACQGALQRWPGVAEEVLIPAVGECDDSWLSDCRAMQVEAPDVAAAWAAAEDSVGGPRPDTGSVGAGTGMSCLGFKGGVGSASRVVGSGHTVGVLLLCNFGERARLTVDGVPVGRLLPPDPFLPAPRPAGSCLGVVVTDAPLDAAGCERLARRVGLGLARTGSTAYHGSGEIFLGVSTGRRLDVAGRTEPGGADVLAGPELDPLFAAVVDASEEAVLDALVASPTTTGRAGHASEGLPVDAVAALLRGHGRG